MSIIPLSALIRKSLMKNILTEFQLDIRKLIKVAGVINGSDSDGDGSGPLPDVLPVHVGKPVELFHLLYVLYSLISTLTQSKIDMIGFKLIETSIVNSTTHL